VKPLFIGILAVGASWFLIDIAGETKEGYYLGNSIPDSDEPLYGQNQYPSAGKVAEQLNSEL